MKCIIFTNIRYKYKFNEGDIAYFDGVVPNETNTNYNYKIVSDDLDKNGIFTDDENEIANNIARKVTIPDENKQIKNKKKDNDTRF